MLISIEKISNISIFIGLKLIQGKVQIMNIFIYAYYIFLIKKIKAQNPTFRLPKKSSTEEQ